MSKKTKTRLMCLGLLTLVLTFAEMAQAQSVNPRVFIPKPPVESAVNIVTTPQECEEIYLADLQECPTLQETFQQFQQCENYEASNELLNCRKRSLRHFQTCHAIVSKAYEECLEQVEQVTASQQQEDPVLSPVSEDGVKD